MSDADLVDKIDLGETAKAFLGSPLGKSLEYQSELDKEAAINDMLNLDPYTIFDLGELQSKIAAIKRDYSLASKVGAYLENFIIEGQLTLDLVNQELEETD